MCLKEKEKEKERRKKKIKGKLGLEKTNDGQLVSWALGKCILHALHCRTVHIRVTFEHKSRTLCKSFDVMCAPKVSCVQTLTECVGGGGAGISIAHI